MKDNQVFPIFDRMLTRADKEQQLRQRSLAIWMTGLSSSGKSTISIALERKLHNQGYLTQIIDGDNVRSGINKNLGFSVEDRHENLRRIAEVNKLFANCGVITINSFISPTNEVRQMARDIIGTGNFFEVFINAPFNVCEGRDVKGLYAKVRKGELKNFTGVDSPFEAPANPDLELRTDLDTIDHCTLKLYNAIIERIELK